MAKLTLSFKDKVLRIFPLLGETLCIGRDPQCHIHIDSLAVEPWHADISLDAEGIRISARPDTTVLVNETAITEPHRLANGDRIQVGKHTLTYSDEGELAHEKVTPIARHMITGWLQIMSGSHFGRSIRLDRAMTRVGKGGQHMAMIARRDDGYYLSHLEGDTTPQVNGTDIGESAHRLQEGDQLRIGLLELHFFLDNQDNDNAPAPVPSEEKPQRQFTRIAFDAGVSLSNGDKTWQTSLIDLSLKGALIAQPDDWEMPDENTPYRLQLQLDDEVAITMDVSVAHQNEGQLGLSCKDIDLDSITHLRRLVELNLGNPNLLERELASLG